MGHVLQKAARSGGTAVVHLEALHPSPRPDADDLAVLAADVQYGPDVGIEMVCAQAIGLDLRDYLVGQLAFGSQVAAIAGGHQAVVALRRQQRPGIAHRVGAGIHDLCARDLLAIPLHQGDGPRADVQAGVGGSGIRFDCRHHFSFCGSTLR